MSQIKWKRIQRKAQIDKESRTSLSALPSKPKPKPFIFGKPKPMTKERVRRQILAGASTHSSKRCAPLADPFEAAAKAQQDPIARQIAQAIKESLK